MNIDITGIVLRINAYKEKDAMVLVLSENGTISFLARGVLSLTSKNASSVLLYAHSVFTLSNKGNNFTLTQGKLISSFSSMYESLEKMSAISFLSEVIIKCLDENNGQLYPYLLKCLELIDKDFDTLTLVCIVLANIIKLSGYSLNYSSCVFCSDNLHIASVSYSEGGFICSNHLRKNHCPQGEDYLKTFLYSFKVGVDKMNHYTFNKVTAINLLKDLTSHLKNSFGISSFKGEEMYLRSIDAL